MTTAFRDPLFSSSTLIKALSSTSFAEDSAWIVEGVAQPVIGIIAAADTLAAAVGTDGKLIPRYAIVTVVAVPGSGPCYCLAASDDLSEIASKVTSALHHQEAFVAAYDLTGPRTMPLALTVAFT